MKSSVAALAGVLLLALGSIGVTAAPGAGRAIGLDLGDGYQFELIGAAETKAAANNPRLISLNVALLDESVHATPARLIEGADRLFESVLMGAAEKGYYSRAAINIRKPGGTTFEDFVYLRGANEVWLRQAGKAPWKVAQDSKWTPPRVEKVQIEGHGTFALEGTIEIQPPEGFQRAAEIDFVTATPMVDVQKKYREIKALWARLDRAKLRAAGFDLIVFGNFAEAQRGRFHARRGYFVRIPRETAGDWPQLPDEAPEDKDLLISKNLRIAPDATTTAVTQVFFANGHDTVRLADVTVAEGGPHTEPLSRIGFGAAAPAMKLDTKVIAIPIK